MKKKNSTTYAPIQTQRIYNKPVFSTSIFGENLKWKKDKFLLKYLPLPLLLNINKILQKCIKCKLNFRYQSNKSKLNQITWLITILSKLTFYS